jgi:hypothetical protein
MPMLYDYRQVEQRKRELYGAAPRASYYRVPLFFALIGVLFLLAYILS